MFAPSKNYYKPLMNYFYFKKENNSLYQNYNYFILRRIYLSFKMKNGNYLLLFLSRLFLVERKRHIKSYANETLIIWIIIISFCEILSWDIIWSKSKWNFRLNMWIIKFKL